MAYQLIIVLIAIVDNILGKLAFDCECPAQDLDVIGIGVFLDVVVELADHALGGDLDLDQLGHVYVEGERGPRVRPRRVFEEEVVVLGPVPHFV